MFRLICFFCLFLSVVGRPVSACDGWVVSDENVYGAPICLGADLRRVVVLDTGVGLGASLDVGLPVVGAPLDLMSEDTLRERAEAAGIQSIGAVMEPSFERIVALQPDLILAFVGSESVAAGIFPMASQLAPTVLYTSLDWQGFYRFLAALTGKGQEVEADLAAFEERLAGVRGRLPDTRVSVVRITSWDFQVYLDAPGTYAPFEILQRAGVIRSAYETTDNPKLSLKRPDWEELNALDGDTLLYIVGGTNASETDGRYEEVMANPLWQALPAVEAGRAFRIDSSTWMEFGGLSSAHRVLDDIERYVIGAP